METIESKESAMGRTRIFLQPIAAPSVLGLYAFAAAMFVVSVNLAGWYGGGQEKSETFIIPFVAVFGGLAQLLAGMWAFRARDTLATAIHGMWGSFWLGYGVLFIFFATGVLPMNPAAYYVPLGYWFCTLAVITWATAVAALSVNIAMSTTLALLAAGSTVGAVGFFTGYNAVITAAGWVFLFSSLLAWWTATGMMFETVLGRSILPIGKRRPATVEPGVGEPAIIRGQ